MKTENIGANLFMLKGETLQEADVCVASNGEESTANIYISIMLILMIRNKIKNY